MDEHAFLNVLDQEGAVGLPELVEAFSLMLTVVVEPVAPEGLGHTVAFALRGKVGFVDLDLVQ